MAALALGGSDGGLGRILMDLVFVRPRSRKQEAEVCKIITPAPPQPPPEFYFPYHPYLPPPR